MKKLFGVQAELNITADEEICKGIGSGIKNGTIVIADIVNEMKPIAIKAVKDKLEKKNETEKK